MMFYVVLQVRKYDVIRTNQAIFWGLARSALLCRSAFSVRLSCWLIHGGVSLVSHDHTNILTSPITRILMLFQPRRWIEPTNYGLITICLIWHAPCA